jgi:hypothetical protein
MGNTIQWELEKCGIFVFECMVIFNGMDFIVNV